MHVAPQKMCLIKRGKEKRKQMQTGDVIRFGRKTAFWKLWSYRCLKFSFWHSFVLELKYGRDSIICGLRMPSFHNDSFSAISVWTVWIINELLCTFMLWFFWCRMRSRHNWYFRMCRLVVWEILILAEDSLCLEK